MTWVFLGCTLSSELRVPEFPSEEEEEEEQPWVLRKELWGSQHWVESFSRAAWDGTPEPPASPDPKRKSLEHPHVEQLPVSTAHEQNLDFVSPNLCAAPSPCGEQEL